MKYGWHAAAIAVLLTIANVVFFVGTCGQPGWESGASPEPRGPRPT